MSAKDLYLQKKHNPLRKRKIEIDNKKGNDMPKYFKWKRSNPG